MSKLEERLRMENAALHSKVRELEQSLANCAQLGVSLRSVLATYERGQEPTPEQLADIAPPKTASGQRE